MRNTHIFTFYYRVISCVLAVIFTFTSIQPPASAQMTLPPIMPVSTPSAANGSGVMLKGLSVFPDNPFQFNFIIDTGDENLQGQPLEDESMKLIKYFLTSLTVPEDELWVNLSPDEPDRIVPESFGQTEMGRDLLAQDYILKQLTASLLSPDNEVGQKFWESMEAKMGKDVSIDLFNKVWIVPDHSTVHVNGNNVFVVDSRLKVRVEDELPENIISAIEHEVNHGPTFTKLRQVFNALILATWYKQNLKSSVLNQIYSDQRNIKGMEHNDQSVDDIYNQYLNAFKDGVYDLIKEEYDPQEQEITTRKYFTGGVNAAMISKTINNADPAMGEALLAYAKQHSDSTVEVSWGVQDAAMGVYPEYEELMLAVHIAEHGGPLDFKDDMISIHRGIDLHFSKIDLFNEEFGHEYARFFFKLIQEYIGIEKKIFELRYSDNKGIDDLKNDIINILRQFMAELNRIYQWSLDNDEKVQFESRFVPRKKGEWYRSHIRAGERSVIDHQGKINLLNKLKRVIEINIPVVLALLDPESITVEPQNMLDFIQGSNGQFSVKHFPLLLNVPIIGSIASDIEFNMSTSVVFMLLERAISNAVNANGFNGYLISKQGGIRIEQGINDIRVIYTNPGHIPEELLDIDPQTGMKHVFGFNYAKKAGQGIGSTGIPFSARLAAKAGIGYDIVNDPNGHEVHTVITIPHNIVPFKQPDTPQFLLKKASGDQTVTTRREGQEQVSEASAAMGGKSDAEADEIYDNRRDFIKKSSLASMWNVVKRAFIGRPQLSKKAKKEIRWMISRILAKKVEHRYLFDNDDRYERFFLNSQLRNHLGVYDEADINRPEARRIMSSHSQEVVRLYRAVHEEAEREWRNIMAAIPEGERDEIYFFHRYVYSLATPKDSLENYIYLRMGQAIDQHLHPEGQSKIVGKDNNFFVTKDSQRESKVRYVIPSSSFLSKYHLLSSVRFLGRTLKGLIKQNQGIADHIYEYVQSLPLDEVKVLRRKAKDDKFLDRLSEKIEKDIEERKSMLKFIQSEEPLLPAAFELQQEIGQLEEFMKLVKERMGYFDRPIEETPEKLSELSDEVPPKRVSSNKLKVVAPLAAIAGSKAVKKIFNRRREGKYRIKTSAAMTATVREHDVFNERVVGKEAEVLVSIAAEISAQLGEDGDYDFRGAIRRLKEEEDERVEEREGSIIVELEKDVGYLILTPNKDPITGERELIIIDSDFGASHVGRTRNQVYAQDFPTAAHALTELKHWKETEENLMKEFEPREKDSEFQAEAQINKEGKNDKPRNIKEWIQQNIELSSFLDELFYEDAIENEKAMIEFILESGVKVGIDRLLELSSIRLNYLAEDGGRNFDSLEDELSIFPEEIMTFEDMVEMFDSTDNWKARILGPPTHAQHRILNLKEYEVKFFQRKSDDTWFAERGEANEGAEDLTVGSRLAYNLEVFNDQGVELHTHPGGLAPPSSKDLSVLHRHKDLVPRGVVDGKYAYIYRLKNPSLTQNIDTDTLEAELSAAFHELDTFFVAKIRLGEYDDKPYEAVFNDMFELWRNHVAKKGFEIVRIPLDELDENLEDFYAQLEDLTPTITEPLDIVITRDPLPAVAAMTATVQEHDVFNEKVVGEARDVLVSIAVDIDAQLGEDGDFDFRGAIRQLKEEGDARIEEREGSIIVELEKDVGYLILTPNKDPITGEQELIIIDPDFGADHIGRSRNQVYARNFVAAVNGVVQLHLWKEVERRLLGSTVDPDTSETVEANIDPNGVHGKPKNIKEWITEHIVASFYLNEVISDDAREKEKVARYMMIENKRKGFTLDYLLNEVMEDINSEVIDHYELLHGNKTLQELLDEFGDEPISVFEMLQLFDREEKTKVLLKQLPTAKQRAALVLKGYEVMFFRRKGESYWYAEKGEEKQVASPLNDHLTLLGETTRDEHNHPQAITEMLQLTTPSPADFIGVLRFGGVGAAYDRKYLYYYAVDDVSIDRNTTEDWKKLKDELTKEHDELQFLIVELYMEDFGLEHGDLFLDGGINREVFNQEEFDHYEGNVMFDLWKKFVEERGFVLERISFDDPDFDEKLAALEDHSPPKGEMDIISTRSSQERKMLSLQAISNASEVTGVSFQTEEQARVDRIAQALIDAGIQGSNVHVLDTLKAIQGHVHDSDIQTLIDAVQSGDGEFDFDNKAYQAVVQVVRGWDKRHWHAHTGTSIHPGFAWNEVVLHSANLMKEVTKVIGTLVGDDDISKDRSAELKKLAKAKVLWHELTEDIQDYFLKLYTFKKKGLDEKFGVYDAGSWKRMVAHVALQHFSDGVTDLRLLMTFIGKEKISSPNGLMDATIAGFQLAEDLAQELYGKKFSVQMVLSYPRHNPKSSPERVKEDIDFLIYKREHDERLKQYVQGLDLAGAEAIIDKRVNTHFRKTSDYEEVIKLAQEAGLEVTAHLGDMGNTHRGSNVKLPTRSESAVSKQKEIAQVEDFNNRVWFHLKFVEDGINAGVDVVQHGTILAPEGSVVTKDSTKAKVKFAGRAITEPRSLELIEELLVKLKREGKEIHTCPTANVNAQTIRLYQGHPFHEWLKRGLKVSINADDFYWGNVPVTLSDDIAKMMLAAPYSEAPTGETILTPVVAKKISQVPEVGFKGDSVSAAMEAASKGDPAMSNWYDNLENVIAVPSGEKAVLDRNDKRYLSATLGCCTAVAAFNKVTGERVFAHSLPTGDSENDPKRRTKEEYIHYLLSDITGSDWNVAIISMGSDESEASDQQIGVQDLLDKLGSQNVPHNQILVDRNGESEEVITKTVDFHADNMVTVLGIRRSGAQLLKITLEDLKKMVTSGAEAIRTFIELKGGGVGSPTIGAAPTSDAAMDDRAMISTAQLLGSAGIKFSPLNLHERVGSHIQQFLVRDHELKHSAFEAIDRLSDEEIINLLDQILAKEYTEHNRGHAVKEISLYGSEPFRVRFFYPTVGFGGDIMQAITQTAIYLNSEHIEMMKKSFPSEDVLGHIKGLYLLIRALEIISRRTDLVWLTEDDIKKDTPLWDILTSSEIQRELSAIDRFVGYSRFFINVLLSEGERTSLEVQDAIPKLKVALNEEKNVGMRETIERYFKLHDELNAESEYWRTGLHREVEPDEIRAEYDQSFAILREALRLANEAMISENPGGIDLNPAMLNLETEGDQIEFNMDIPPAIIERIHTEGIQPVIYQITPVTNLPFLLGLEETDEPQEEELAQNIDLIAIKEDVDNFPSMDTIDK